VLTNLETAQVLFQVFILCGADIFQCNEVDFSSCHGMAIKIPFYHVFDTLLIFRTSLMEVQEFVKRWQVSREELAFICDCSLTTVNHWFSEGKE